MKVYKEDGRADYIHLIGDIGSLVMCRELVEKKVESLDVSMEKGKVSKKEKRSFPPA